MSQNLSPQVSTGVVPKVEPILRRLPVDTPPAPVQEHHRPQMIQPSPTPGWSTIEATDLEAVRYAVIALGLNQLGQYNAR